MEAGKVRGLLDLRKIRPRAIIALVFGVIVFGVLYWWSVTPNAYAVYLDDRQIGIASDQAAVETSMQQVISEKSLEFDQKLTATQKISFQPVRAANDQMSSLEEIQRLLADELNMVTGAVAIRINGQDRLTVANQQVADELLAEVKQHYRPPVEDIRIEKEEIKDNVELVPVKVDPVQVMNKDDALALLINGTKTMQTHIVKEGESLWTIATDNNLWPEDLMAANPQLKSDLLQIGQELKLVKAEPYINVVTTWDEKLKETIPYPVKVINDSSLYRGQEKVVDSGEKGQKEMQYRFVAENGLQVNEEIISENVVKEPKQRVIKRGTKVMVASRGGGGSGQLAWPLQGVITSPYGTRWGRMHEGIDIDGNTGDPIYAAAAGTVIFAGWSGGYGRLLIIDHGDGLTTRYSHMSGFKVSTGDKVKRGDMIGLVGATGDATGSHLHFEVRVNGSIRNPINYLR